MKKISVIENVKSIVNKMMNNELVLWSYSLKC